MFQACDLTLAGCKLRSKVGLRQGFELESEYLLGFRKYSILHGIIVGCLRVPDASVQPAISRLPDPFVVSAAIVRLPMRYEYVVLFHGQLLLNLLA